MLIDEKLHKLDIDSRHIIGYENEELSHLAVASCVARREADVGLGTEKAAMQVKNVEFIPLQKERYDMVLLKQDLEKPHFQALISILKSNGFQNEVDGMDGYDRNGRNIREADQAIQFHQPAFFYLHHYILDFCAFDNTLLL